MSQAPTYSLLQQSNMKSVAACMGMHVHVHVHVHVCQCNNVIQCVQVHVHVHTFKPMYRSRGTVVLLSAEVTSPQLSHPFLHMHVPGYGDSVVHDGLLQATGHDVDHFQEVVLAFFNEFEAHLVFI